MNAARSSMPQGLRKQPTTAARVPGPCAGKAGLTSPKSTSLKDDCDMGWSSSYGQRTV